MTLLDSSVTRDGDTWTFACPGVRDNPCGDKGVPFFSSGWPTKKSAVARGGQHFAEHKLGVEIGAATQQAVSEAVAAATAKAKNPEDAVEVAALRAEASDSVDRAGIRDRVIAKSEHSPMQELHDFRVDQGLVVNDDGSVTVKDL